MFNSDIVDRLTVDPGRRTLGELLQAVRWRTEDIQVWRGSLVASPR